MTAAGRASARSCHGKGKAWMVGSPDEGMRLGRGANAWFARRVQVSRWLVMGRLIKEATKAGGGGAEYMQAGADLGGGGG